MPKRRNSGLTDKQLAFCNEYLIDLNITSAAMRAGYSKKTAYSIGSEMMKNPLVQEKITELQQARSKRTEISADEVLRRFWTVATADPSNLVQFRRHCCRHCYGENHLYQWRDKAEFDHAVKSANDNGTKIPSDDGGYGFNKFLDPVDDCPHCGGEGYGDVFITDTRKLDEQSKSLFAGAKPTKDGVEILMKDQLTALTAVAKHLGMFKNKVELSVNERLAARLARARNKLKGSNGSS